MADTRCFVELNILSRSLIYSNVFSDYVSELESVRYTISVFNIAPSHELVGNELTQPYSSTNKHTSDPPHLHT